ncbi:hypothetical protein B0J14DRAFT_565541 [Halenospora varia]|nr:hypothetical protein B0J14DRAFT_565541 [Halenospora varia]
MKLSKLKCTNAQVNTTQNRSQTTERHGKSNTHLGEYPGATQLPHQHNYLFVFATEYGSIANAGAPLLEEYCTYQTETFLDHNGKFRPVQGGCTDPTNPYGRSKWMCEAILSDLALADPRLIIITLRYFNSVGCEESGLLAEDPRGVPTDLIPVVAKVLTGDSPALDVYGTDHPTQNGTAV